MTPGSQRLLGLLVAALALLAPAPRARADPPTCPPAWGRPAAGRRPTGRLHKVRIRMPDDLCRDPIRRGRLAAALARGRLRVLRAPGPCVQAAFLVRASDAQLDALARRVAGVYRNPVAGTRRWFEPADDLDLLEGTSLVVDTGTTPPGALPVPRGWALAAGPRARIHWLVHLRAPLAAARVPAWLTAPGRQAPVEIVDQDATHLLVRTTAAGARWLRGRPGVDWVGRYEAAWKLDASLAAPGTCFFGPAGARRLLSGAGAHPARRGTFTVRLFRWRPGLLRAITAAGGKASRVDDTTLRVTGPRRLVRWLARRVEVRSIGAAAVARVD